MYFYHCTQKTGVKVSNVFFTDIYGTSTNEEAITLDCNEKVPCINIQMKNIKLTRANSEEPVTMSCISARGTALSVEPKSCLED